MNEVLDNEIRTLRAHFWSERDPDGRAFVPLADAYLRRGDLDEARALLEDGLGRLPDFASGHLVAARVHRARGDGEATRAAVARLRQLDPENSAGLRLHGELLEEDGQIAEALEAFRRAWALNPEYDDLEGRVSRLEVKVAGGDPSESKSAIEGMVTGAEVYADSIEGEALPVEGERAEEPLDDPVFELSEESEVPDEPTEDPAFEDLDALDEAPAQDDLDEVGPLAADDLDTLTPWAETFEVETPGDDPLDVDFEDLDSTESLEETPGEEVEVDFGDLDFGAPGLVSEESEEEVEPEEVLDPETVLLEEPFELESDPGQAEPADGVEDTTAEDASDAEDPSPTVTRTLGELYFRQGLTGQAIEVFEELVRRRPDDESLRARLHEMKEGDPEAADASESSPEAADPEAADESEGRTIDAPVEVAESPSDELDDDRHDERPERSTAWADEAEEESPEELHTPFAWDAEEEDASGVDQGLEAVDDPEEGAGPPTRTIGGYLNDLRAWVPGAVPVESLDPSAVPIESLAPELELDARDGEDGDGDLDDFQEWLRGLRR